MSFSSSYVSSGPERTWTNDCGNCIIYFACCSFGLETEAQERVQRASLQQIPIEGRVSLKLWGGSPKNQQIL